MLSCCVIEKEKEKHGVGMHTGVQLQGVISMLVSTQLEPNVQFGALLCKKMLATVEVERKTVKMTRDPEDMPQGKNLKRLFASPKEEQCAGKHIGDRQFFKHR